MPGEEAAIEQQLPTDGVTRDRTRLLRELTNYADHAVREARGRGPARPAAAEVAGARGWLARPVFICGHHRSGTTLLHELLDGHPELMVLPNEATYFDSFGYVTGPRPGDARLDRFCAEWIARLIDPNFPPHFRLGQSSADAAPYVEFARRLFGWHEALRADTGPPLTPLLALAAACRDSLPGQVEPRQWVEKTPLNERHARVLARIPGARFIQLVREPRAVFASLRALYSRDARLRFQPAAAAHALGDSLRRAQANPRKFAGRYLVVKYEDLANQPAREMERVRQFLGLAAHAGLLVPTAGGAPVRANSAFEAGTPGVVRPASAPPRVSESDESLLRAFAGGPARDLGYALGEASWRDVVSAWRHRILPPSAGKSSIGP